MTCGVCFIVLCGVCAICVILQPVPCSVCIIGLLCGWCYVVFVPFVLSVPFCVCFIGLCSWCYVNICAVCVVLQPVLCGICFIVLLCGWCYVDVCASP